jgi:hypothetical protein
MKSSDESASEADLREMKFPDWTGMDDSANRVSPDAAFRFCEQYREWFPELCNQARLDRPEKCLVEFTL